MLELLKIERSESFIKATVDCLKISKALIKKNLKSLFLNDFIY